MYPFSLYFEALFLRFTFYVLHKINGFSVEPGMVTENTQKKHGDKFIYIIKFYY